MTPREIRERMRRGVDLGVQRLAEAALLEATGIIRDEAFDEGTLARSGEIRKEEDFVRVLAHTAEHARYVHDGTRPHWPPLEPIKAWVRRNLAVTDDGETVLKPGVGTAVRRAPADAVERVARAIQAKIAVEGTDGVFFQLRAERIVKPKAGGLIAKSIREQFK